MALPDDALAVVRACVEHHRGAPLDHSGEMTSSLDLLRSIRHGAGFVGVTMRDGWR
jgi:hypothetical protein